MRRSLLIAAAVASALTAVPAFAQQNRQRDRQAEDQARQDEQRERRRQQEWNDSALPLLGTNAAGPCPFVKVLYDAARVVEFQDARVAASNVTYSGEIEGVTARCAYSGTDPIQLQLMVTFSVGKGPMGPSAVKDYGYWVAVTTRNADILAKEQFALQVEFPAGVERMVVSDLLEGITIPRASDKVMGSQFEVLIGFNVNAQQAAFNRSGSRFRVDASSAAAAAGPPAAGTSAAQ